MSGTTSYDSITAGSDLIATYDVEGVNGVFSGTVSGVAVTGTGNVSGVDGVFSGSVSVGAGPVTWSTGTAAPTHNAIRGSLYTRYAVTGTAGSDVANAAMYMNVSASGTAGSTWLVLGALTSTTL